MLMDIALYNNSSLPPYFVGIIFGFVERPVVDAVEVIPFVDLIPWMRRASLSYTPTADEPFVSFQVRPD